MTTTINASTSTGLVQTADTSGILNIQSNGVNTNAQAWVRFNGVTTVTIGASYNVSSVTRNSAGNYTINFTNAMTDANYCAVGSAVPSTSGGGFFMGPFTSSPTTSAYRFITTDGGFSQTDAAFCSVAVFR